MVKLSNLNVSLQVLAIVSGILAAASLVNFVLFMVHTDGFSTINDEHLTDAEKARFLSPDREVSLIVTDTSGSPIVFEDDVIFNDVSVLQNDLSLSRAIFRRLLVNRLLTREFEGAPGDFVDITDIVTFIQNQINDSPADVVDLTADLIQQMMRYTNVKGDINATCANYTTLITLEETQQTDLVAQDIEITNLENSLFGNGTFNGTIFDTYDTQSLIDTFLLLQTDVDILEVDVVTLLVASELLNDTITSFIDMGSNGTSVLAMVVDDTLILTGQIGTLFNNTQDLVDSCNSSNANATNLLTTINTQISLIDVTQITVINSSLLQIGSDITNIVNVLNQIDNETTVDHSNLIAQLVSLNQSVSDCKILIDEIQNRTDLFLNAANSTQQVVTTSLVTTDVTLQTFVTTVQTFFNNTGLDLLANASATNDILTARYNTLVSNSTTLQNLVTILENDITSIGSRIGVAQNNISVLGPLIMALDPEISQLLVEVTSLKSSTEILESNADTFNDLTNTLYSNLVLINSSFVTLQADISTANSTSVTHGTTLVDHETRIVALENQAASLGGVGGEQFYRHIIPSLTAGESITAGDVVSVDETGRVVVAGGLRQVDSFEYAQTTNFTIGGGILTVTDSDNIHGGRVVAVDAYDNMFLSLNYEGSGIQFENAIIIDNVVSTIQNTRASQYSGIGDVLLAKFSFTREFVWAVAVDGSFSTTISGTSVDPQTQRIWVTGHIMDTGELGLDFSLSPTSRDLVFHNADSSIAFTHTIGVGANDTLSHSIAVGFMGAISQTGDWEKIFIFEADGYSGQGRDFVAAQDLTIDRNGNIYGCGFFSRETQGQTISWLEANLFDGVSVSTRSSLTSTRANLPGFNGMSSPFLADMSRTAGFHFKYDSIGDTINWWRSDEGVDITTSGSEQNPFRFTSIRLDQADTPFILGWYGLDTESGSTNVNYDYRFVIDASNVATTNVTLDRGQERGMQFMLARLDKNDGDYVWITKDRDPLVGVLPGCEFSRDHTFPAGVPVNETLSVFEYFDPAYSGSFELNHRGDVIFTHKCYCDGDFTFESTREGVTNTSVIATISNSTHIVLRFSGSTGIMTDHVYDQVVGTVPLGASKLVIGPDSYVWVHYRQIGNANLGGSNLVVSSDPTQYADYFYKLTPDFTVLWGSVRQSDVAAVDDLSSMIVDRHRNLWFMEDIFNGPQTFNLTQTPSINVTDLAFRMVKAVDLTHIPIGISLDTVTEASPVNVVMHGIVLNVTLPTIAGRNYCNYHGVLQTSNCYSMPSMGYAPSNGTLSVGVHRDALRFPTRANTVY